MKNLILSNGRRMLAVLMSAIMLAGIFVSMPFTASAAGGEYVEITARERQAIADYALDLCLNPAMKRSLSLDGGDCTSFTSTALLAGGISYDKTSSMKWHYYDASNSSNWNGTSGLNNYIIGHLTDVGSGLALERIYSGSHTGLNVSVIPGDIVYFTGHHMAIVVVGGSSSSTIVTANHSRNTIMRLDSWTNAYSPVPSIAVYRIVGYHNQTLSGSQAPITPAPYKKGSMLLRTDETVSMTLDSGLSFGSSIPKLIAVQTYEDLRNPTGVGYCTDFNRSYNGEGAMNPAGAETNPRVVKAISYGYNNTTQTVASVNTALGLSGGNALQNVAECEYVTQMAVWYALGDITRSGSQLKYGSHNIYTIDNSPYANTREYFGVASPMRDAATAAASQRVYNAVLKMADIIDSSAPAPSSTPPTITVNPPSPNKCVYNASQDAFFAGPYTVTSSSATSQFTVDLRNNSVGATVVNTSYATQSTFSWGSQFYVKVPKTAGISDLTVRASAQYQTAPALERFTPVSSSSAQGAIVPKSTPAEDIARAETNLHIETFGKISVHKVTNKSENLQGVTFGVFSNPACTTYVKDPINNRDVKMVSDSAGNATSVDLLPSTVYVKEIDMTAEQHLVLNMNPTVYQIAVAAGVTTPINAQAGTVVNDYKTITLQIQKENARPDMMTYSLKGAVFEIRNTTTNQKWTVTTNESGFAEQKDIPLGLIECEEKTAPYGFEVNKTVQKYDLRKGEKGVDIILQRCVFPEEPQTATVKITKYDAETNTRPQGNSQLTNAQFSILAKTDVTYLDGTVKYKKDTVIQTLNCGPSSTSVTSMELPVGFDYYIREDEPPVGMTPLGHNIDFTLEYKGQEVKTYLYDASVKNIVIKGQIEIFKLMEGNPGNETTLNGENGAKFQVWLKSAGSYGAALSTEKDLITTANNPVNGLAGWAKTKLLPYGVYVVHQVQPENDTEPIPDFEVFINTNLKSYPFYKWNGPVVAFVQMAKLDADSKQVIPLPNTAFKLWDYQTNDWYSVRTTYPSVIWHDTFYTDSTGTVTLPEPLRPGRFRWVETSAPYAYVNPIAIDPDYKGLDFVVDQNMQVVDGSYMIKDNIPIFLFEHEDVAQKARIGVDKFGDQFSSVRITQSDFGSVTSPVFTRQRLAGCQFIIRAKTDIYTPDGTLRYKAGQTVDTLISSATQTVYSKLLYLGDFEVLEVSSVSGFIKEDGARDVSLVYRGEMIVSFDVIETFDNERGQVKLELEKLMAALPGSGEKPFNKVKYGLYSNQDFTDYLGNVRISKGTLMEIISLDDMGKYSSQKAMIWGDYAVRELATSDLHQLDTNEYSVAIQPDNPTQKVKTISIKKPDGKLLTNDLIKGRVKIDKIGLQFVGVEESGSEFGKLYTPIFEERPLDRAEFDIISKNDIFLADGTKVVSAGEVVDHLVTSGGKAESKPLYLGYYICVETKVDGMVLDATPHEISLDETNFNGEIVLDLLDITNARQKVSIELNKTAEIPAGADEDYDPYSFIRFGLFAREDITDQNDEIVIPKDGLVAVISVDSEGKGLLDGYLPYSDFYAKEIQTSPLHQLLETEFDFSAQFRGSDIEVVDIKINDGEIIVNELKRAKIKVIKVDNETLVPLENVTFMVVDPDGNTVCEIITGPDGIAETDWLLVSDKPYSVIEKSTLNNYVLNETPYEIILTEHEKVYELELGNQRIRGKIKVFKTDGSTNTPLEGVVFEVRDADGNFITTITSGADGVAITDYLEYGKYRIFEKSTLSNYILDETVHEIEITEHEKVYELALKNNKIPEIPKTGDDSNPALWLGLMAASMGAVVLTLCLRKRKTK